MLGRTGRSYAERRYREGLRTWRTAIRKPLLLIVGPFFFGSVVWGILENHPSAYLAGFITGLSGAVAVMFREYAPPYVENWGLGGRGEQMTHRALRPLRRRGWTVVEDIGSRRFGNYDHVAIGPAGVFLIDSKYLRGTVKIDGRIPRLHRKYDPEGRDSLRKHGRQVIAASIELRGIIGERTGNDLHVDAIVVYWNPFPDKRLETEQVTYLQGRELCPYLLDRPAILDTEAQAAIGTAVQALKDQPQA